MKREDIAKFRLTNAIERHESYEFPEFLLLIRKQYGMNRRAVSQDIGIDEGRLLYIEKGRFKREITGDELKLLGNYYGVDSSLLKKKMEKFVRCKLNSKGNQS